VKTCKHFEHECQCLQHIDHQKHGFLKWLKHHEHKLFEPCMQHLKDWTWQTLWVCSNSHEYHELMLIACLQNFGLKTLWTNENQQQWVSFEFRRPQKKKLVINQISNSKDHD